ncbi:hypothetical protein FDF15_06035 [Clostridium botulinum]|uniref:hypothetical protein n=1 Tax=Clostridium botulinum TaxID=1491 RepID=UPI000774CE5E|nr:hypothetical protein [Clostridium botulinum]APH22402.1 hypothetical protein NPD1_3557 [Clostridium botulinum]APQ70474.1 hypothetical protein RSJ8_1683 [Clostridium botulinum]MBN3377404.1 hypothetical protein [Clostridium botulinum]MBY6996880.1 hypothetical protein [Clostridium botulinum]MBY7010589.1 hypothetical protein [Clostridium botulinum]
MEKIIKYLLPKEYYTYDLDDNKLYYFIANKDKIIFITSINKLEEVDLLTIKLSELKNEIFKSLLNEDQLHYVNESGQVIKEKKKMTMPAFLWDLYIVGLHNIKDNKSFKINEVERVKRDKFIARKIIIEYKDLKDLKTKFTENVFPGVIIKEKLGSIKPPNIHITDLLEGVDIKEVVQSLDNSRSEVTSNDVIEYLDNVINKYIIKGE